MALGETGKKTGKVFWLDGQPLERGVPWTAEVARLATDNFCAAALDDEKDLGARSHRRGTTLVILFTHGADLALGHTNFLKFCAEQLDLKRAAVMRAMRLAKNATEEEARAAGLTRARLGITLMRLLKVPSLTELGRQELLDEEGNPVRFPGTTRALESALRRLRKQKATAVDPALQAEVDRRNERVAKAFATERALKGVTAEHVVEDGEVLLALPPLTPAQLRALARVAPLLS